jgi:hypothetical protein
VVEWRGRGHGAVDLQLPGGLARERPLERVALLDRGDLGPDLIDHAAKAGASPTGSHGPRLYRAPKLRGAKGKPGCRRFVGNRAGATETQEATPSDVLAEGRLDDHAADGRPAA